jgi:hypothetical protein
MCIYLLIITIARLRSSVRRDLVRITFSTQGTGLRRLAHEPKRVVKVILDAMVGIILGKLMVHVLIDWL